MDVGGIMSLIKYVKGYFCIFIALLTAACATNSAHHGWKEVTNSGLDNSQIASVWANKELKSQNLSEEKILAENLQILEDLSLEDDGVVDFHQKLNADISEISSSINSYIAENSLIHSEIEKDDVDYLYLIKPGSNIRSEDLKTVISHAQLNEQVWLTGKKKSPEGTNYAFEEVSFADGMTGWVASHLLEPLESNMGEERIILVNLSTNRLSFVVDGRVEAEWNIGSGKDNDGNITPVGSYKILFKDRCSVWLPKGKGVQGPCRDSNPLGDFQVWFHKGRTYGLHGTNEEALLADKTTPEERRVSGGCVRNPNEQMAWLYRRVKVGDTIEIGYFGYDSGAMLSALKQDELISERLYHN